MTKLIILTPSIIRGEFHKKTIGYFYTTFFQYFKHWEIYHIINIDSPEYLKKYFNNYETINIFNEIIPNEVNKIYNVTKKPGFLFAFKNIINKIKEHNLENEKYYYWWLEDDWVHKHTYNFFKILDKFCQINNSAFILTNNAPLGSFRAGPFMSGSYFFNFFNIEKIGVMNVTCDPEKQVYRWISGIERSNGNQMIYRNFRDNNIIQIIYFSFNTENIILHKIPFYYYNKKFNNKITFKYYVISYNENDNLYKFSNIIDNKFNLELKSFEYINNFFDNNYIKYFSLEPYIFKDKGRYFSENYELEKWQKLGEGTTYKLKKPINAQLGNWKNLELDELRLRSNLTLNKGFFSSLLYIIQLLPYLEKKYFEKDIKLNFSYISHVYGSYPNFEVIGNKILMNYKPSYNQFIRKNCNELIDLKKVFHNLFGEQSSNDIPSNFFSFKNKFKSANIYFNKYFKFNDDLIDIKNKFIKKFTNKKVIGIHFRGTDKLKVNWIKHLSIKEYILILDYHLENNYYDIIHIASDCNDFIKQIKNIYGNKYAISCYKQELSNNGNALHMNRKKNIDTFIKKIKKSKNLEEKLLNENALKLEAKINEKELTNLILDSLILSHCNFVLKTHSQVSSFSKIFNPNLEIYRLNSALTCYWPESHIPFYPLKLVKNSSIKKLLINFRKDEIDETFKSKYKDL